jgi:hypothetical protein
MAVEGIVLPGRERISIPYHQVIVSVTPVVLISIGIVL